MTDKNTRKTYCDGAPNIRVGLYPLRIWTPFESCCLLVPSSIFLLNLFVRMHRTLSLFARRNALFPISLPPHPRLHLLPYNVYQTSILTPLLALLSC